MAFRICGELMDNDRQHINIALRKIFGIGQTRANQICDNTEVDRATRVKDIAEDKLAKIRKYIEANFSLLQGDLKREIALNIKNLKDIGCYKGRRHRAGLPGRGQNTKNNAKTCKRRRRK